MAKLSPDHVEAVKIMLREEDRALRKNLHGTTEQMMCGHIRALLKAGFTVTRASPTQEASPMPETMRVRILVGINPSRQWDAIGGSSWSDGAAQREARRCYGNDFTYHWIEADVPVPEEVKESVIVGQISDGGR